MEVTEIRKTIVSALASDGQLVRLLVFKGGNALELVHNIGQRSSLDLDYSIPADIDNPRQFGQRLFKVLREEFARHSYVLFDEEFGPRPSNRQLGDQWGGYAATFKLIDIDSYEKLGGDLDNIRRQSLPIGPNNRRTFKIEISAFEYCEGSIRAKIDGHTAVVYSIEMIAVEKLRAICQQSDKYSLRAHPSPRARDFYDIFAAVTEGSVDFSSPGVHQLARKIFGAKRVDLSLIGEIHLQREFHRSDWPSVQGAVRVRLRQFDYYFDFLLAEIEKLDALWIE